MKLRILISFLFFILLPIWSLTHYWLVKTFHIHSWRYFGLAMYAAPEPRLYAEIRRKETESSNTEQMPREKLPDQIEYHIRMFLILQGNFGSFFGPERVFRALEYVYGRADSWFLDVIHLEIDPETGKVARNIVTYALHKGEISLKKKSK